MHDIKRALRLVCLASLLIGFAIGTVFLKPTAAGAQDNINAQKLERLITKFYSDPKNLQKIVERFGISRDKEVLLLLYFEEIFQNPKFVKNFVEELISQNVLNKEARRDEKTALARGMSFGYQFSTTLSVKGMKRLSDERLREYIKFVSRFFELIEPRHCRALLGASTRQKDEIEASLVAIKNMKTAEMKSFFELNGEAINAELNDWPYAVALNDYEVRTGAEVYERELAKALTTNPYSTRIVTALTEPSKAQDRDFCIAGKFVMDTVVSLDGMAGNWFRRSFVQSL